MLKTATSYAVEGEKQRRRSADTEHTFKTQMKSNCIGKAVRPARGAAREHISWAHFIPNTAPSLFRVAQDCATEFVCKRFGIAESHLLVMQFSLSTRCWDMDNAVSDLRYYKIVVACPCYWRCCRCSLPMQIPLRIAECKRHTHPRTNAQFPMACPTSGRGFITIITCMRSWRNAFLGNNRKNVHGTIEHRNFECTRTTAWGLHATRWHWSPFP